jgi:Tol biopolymer transport system component
VIFAPGVISVEGKNDHTLSFSPDGQEVYFTRDPERVTMFMRQENGQWTEPQVAAFRGREALFAPDGNRLFFNDGDLWFVEKTASGWSEPQNLGAPVNSSEHDYYASVTRDGTLYFSRIVDDHARIFRSPQVNGQYLEITELGSPVNGPNHSYHPFISPDESYLLFNSMPLAQDDDADLYVSFRRDDGSWTEPQNLGEPINSDDGDLCPVISPDGKYLFFTRYRDGAGDIYWVSAEIIEQLRVKVK